MNRSDVLCNMSGPPRTNVASRVVAVYHRPVAFCLGFFFDLTTYYVPDLSRTKIHHRDVNPALGLPDGTWHDLKKRLARRGLPIATEPVLPDGLPATVIGWDKDSGNSVAGTYDRCTDPALTLAVLSRTVANIFFANRPPDYDWDHCLVRVPVFFDDPCFRRFPLQTARQPAIKKTPTKKTQP